jgi:hypothetical protein
MMCLVHSLKEKGSYSDEFPLLQERARVRWKNPCHSQVFPLLEERARVRWKNPCHSQVFPLLQERVRVRWENFQTRKGEVES